MQMLQVLDVRRTEDYVMEMRKARRYYLRAPALFFWAPQDRKQRKGQGVTRDINTFGVYVLTRTLPPVGALIQMEISLPKLAGPGSGMRLHGEGMVLRCEHGDPTKSGFAVSAQFYPDIAEMVLSELNGAVAAK